MLSENSRKITVLQVNEKSLIRQYTTLVEMERQLRKENGKHKNDLVSMEAEVTEKIGSLQRFKVFLKIFWGGSLGIFQVWKQWDSCTPVNSGSCLLTFALSSFCRLLKLQTYMFLPYISTIESFVCVVVMMLFYWNIDSISLTFPQCWLYSGSFRSRLWSWIVHVLNLTVACPDPEDSDLFRCDLLISLENIWLIYFFWFYQV